MKISVVDVSHMRLRRVASVMPREATIRMMKASPSMRQPIPILVTLEGSLPRFACQAQNIESSGARMKIMAGLKA